MITPSTMKKPLPFFFLFSISLSLFYVDHVAAVPSSSHVSTGPAPPPPANPGVVGVTYKPNTPGIPPPNEVVPAIIDAGIPRVRLINPDSISISAFANTEIELNLSIEDKTRFTSIANSSAAALQYINVTVAPYYRKVRITSISVGYGILTLRPYLSDRLYTAVNNIYQACRSFNITGISVSTAHAFQMINNVFPPSSAEFNQSFVPYLKKLLEFEASTQGAFQIDLFPFLLYHSRKIPGLTTSYVMFEAREEDFLDDPVTKKRYRNMFDIMVDAAIVSLVKLGHPTMPVLVVGTGWPSSGNMDEVPEATKLYAAEYNERVVARLNLFLGTPLRPQVTPVTFIYGLFDDQIDDDADSFNNNWGIMNGNLQLKYAINFAPPVTSGAGRWGEGEEGVFARMVGVFVCSALVAIISTWLL